MCGGARYFRYGGRGKEYMTRTVSGCGVVRCRAARGKDRRSRGDAVGTEQYFSAVSVIIDSALTLHRCASLALSVQYTRTWQKHA